VVVDFDQPNNRDVMETVMTLAHMARFIVADISEPGTVIAELESIESSKLHSVPVQPILLSSSNQNSAAWFQNIKRNLTIMLPIYTYSDLDDLRKNIYQKVIMPAEKYRKKILPEHIEKT
jgi:hypothetical protein